MGTLRRMLTAAARALPARPARPAISDARSPPQAAQARSSFVLDAGRPPGAACTSAGASVRTAMAVQAREQGRYLVAGPVRAPAGAREAELIARWQTVRAGPGSAAPRS